MVLVRPPCVVEILNPLRKQIVTDRAAVKIRFLRSYPMLLLLVVRSVCAADSAPADMERLATDKGCYLCHRAGPNKAREGALLPYAPSWAEIARKYRGQAAAEDRLTVIVLGGSDPIDRHWRGKVSDSQMLPNVPEIDGNQARQLVRWILSFRS